MFGNNKIQRTIKKVPPKTLLKGTAIIVLAPSMILLILFFYGRLDIFDAILAVSGIFIISVIFVHPYLANLSALTDYVDQLSENKEAMPPDLSFLNNVESLQSSVERLQNSWEIRNNQLESYLNENKVLINSLPNILILLNKDLSIIQTNDAGHSAFMHNGVDNTLDYIINNDAINKTAKQVLEDKKGRTLEISLPEPINRDYMVKLKHFPVFSPRGIALIMVMHDITELKRAEQTFADFVANASHEIRTPLTSIVGFIETLRTTAKDDEEATDDFLILMEEQAERMSKLVTELLSLSRIEQNINARPTDKVDITEILKNALKQVDWDASNQGMIIETTIQENLPEITGDADQIGQIIHNLLTNAIKYSKRDTAIDISLSVEKNKTNEDIFTGVEQIICLSITDHGEGIAKEHLPRLSERFYRVDKARSRKLGGTGLGLSIVKHILERHKGTLTVESEIGKGSTFTIKLPV
jgi:two-component system phosphate regulon sensor histidine kinase PhoR